MYNRYLNQFPVDVTPKPVHSDPPPAPPESPHNSSSGLFSLLSDSLGQKSGLNDLISEENMIVLAALAFLAYNRDGLDTELLVLAVLFLLIGL